MGELRAGALGWGQQLREWAVTQGSRLSIHSQWQLKFSLRASLLALALQSQ